MPVYNAAPYLRESIDSILGQTYADFELILINDGSTDSSGSIMDSYEDTRIKHIDNKTNAGLVAALNLGINLAQGEFIARMDADDISLPERFARQVEFMDRHPDVGACGTAYQYFGDLDRTEIPIHDSRKAFTFLSTNSSLGHPTTMIRRSVLNLHSIRYESKYGFAADYAFWIRIGQFAKITSLPEPLLLYRWHSSNMSKTDPDREKAVAQARILWHELMIGRELERLEKQYFEENATSLEAFQAGSNLILTILQQPNNQRVDAEYYGKLAVTEWELKIINGLGLRGLLTCFLQPTFRKWSRATAVGLAAHYLGRFGIKLKQ